MQRFGFSPLPGSVSTIRSHVEQFLSSEFEGATVAIDQDAMRGDYIFRIFVDRYGRRFRCDATVSFSAAFDAAHMGNMDKLVEEVVKMSIGQLEDAFCKHLESLGLR